MNFANQDAARIRELQGLWADAQVERDAAVARAEEAEAERDEWKAATFDADRRLEEARSHLATVGEATTDVRSLDVPTVAEHDWAEGWNAAMARVSVALKGGANV